MDHDDFLSELIEKNPPLIRLLTNQTVPQDDAEDALGNLHQLISNEAIGDDALRDKLTGAKFFKMHRNLSK